MCVIVRASKQNDLTTWVRAVVTGLFEEIQNHTALRYHLWPATRGINSVRRRRVPEPQHPRSSTMQCFEEIGWMNWVAQRHRVSLVRESDNFFRESGRCSPPPPYLASRRITSDRNRLVEARSAVNPTS